MSCGCLPRSAYFTQTRRNRASSRYCSNRVSRSSRVHRSSRGNTSVSRPPEVNVCSAHLMKRTQTSRGSSPAYVASASRKRCGVGGSGARHGQRRREKKRRLTCSRVHPSKAKTAGRRCWFRRSEI